MFGAEDNEFKLGYVNLESVEVKVVAEARQRVFQTRDKVRNVGFWARNNDLSVVGVLHDLCVAGVQAQVIDERAEENWAQARALEDALIAGLCSTHFFGLTRF